VGTMQLAAVTTISLAIWLALWAVGLQVMVGFFLALAIIVHFVAIKTYAPMIFHREDS